MSNRAPATVETFETVVIARPTAETVDTAASLYAEQLGEVAVTGTAIAASLRREAASLIKLAEELEANAALAESAAADLRAE